MGLELMSNVSFDGFIFIVIYDLIDERDSFV